MGSYIFHLQSEAVLLLASVTQKKNVLKGSGMTLLVVKKKKKGSFTCPLSLYQKPLEGLKYDSMSWRIFCRF